MRKERRSHGRALSAKRKGSVSWSRLALAIVFSVMLAMQGVPTRAIAEDLNTSENSTLTEQPGQPNEASAPQEANTTPSEEPPTTPEPDPTQTPENTTPSEGEQGEQPAEQQPGEQQSGEQQPTDQQTPEGENNANNSSSSETSEATTKNDGADAGKKDDKKDDKKSDKKDNKKSDEKKDDKKPEEKKEEEKKEDEKPVSKPIDYVGNANGLVVEIHAPEGAFLAGTIVFVRPADAKALMGASGDLVEGEPVDARAVDISFVYEGHEVEPAAGTSVAVSLFPLFPVKGEDFSAVHIKDSGAAEVVNNNATMFGASFQANEFSVYGIVGGSVVRGADEQFTRLKIVFRNSAKSEGAVVSTQIVHAGDKIQEPSPASFTWKAGGVNVDRNKYFNCVLSDDDIKTFIDTYKATPSSDGTNLYEIEVVADCGKDYGGMEPMDAPKVTLHANYPSGSVATEALTTKIVTTEAVTTKAVATEAVTTEAEDPSVVLAVTPDTPNGEVMLPSYDKVQFVRPKGFKFIGWGDNSEGTGMVYAAGYSVGVGGQPGENTDLYAIWESRGNKLVDAELKESSFTYTGEAITPKPIVFNEGDVELTEGVDYTLEYQDNIEVTTDEKQAIVRVIPVPGSDYEDCDIVELYFNIVKPEAGKLRQEVKSTNYGGAKVSQTDDMLAQIITLTDDEKHAMDYGKDAIFWIEAKDVTNSLDNSTKSSLHSVIGLGYTQGVFLDITAWIKVGDGEARQLHEFSTPLSITLSLPSPIKADGRTYLVARSHDGSTSQIASAYAKGTLGIYTDRLSIFEVAYKNKTKLASRTTSALATRPRTSTLARTADPTVWALAGVPAMLGFLAVGTGVSKSRRKK